MHYTSLLETHQTVTVLSVTALEDDQTSLSKIFDRWPATVCPDVHWNLRTRSSVETAVSVLEHDEIAILLCDSDSKSDLWRELLLKCENLKHPPCLIVTSREADERLWAEALNLGAYDVLAKPFDVTEVTRTLSRAVRHWTDNCVLAIN